MHVLTSIYICTFFEPPGGSISWTPPPKCMLKCVQLICGRLKYVWQLFHKSTMVLGSYAETAKVPILKEVNFGKVKLWDVEHFWTLFVFTFGRDCYCIQQSRPKMKTKSVQKCSTSQSFTLPKWHSFKIGTLVLHCGRVYFPPYPFIPASPFISDLTVPSTSSFLLNKQHKASKEMPSIATWKTKRYFGKGISFDLSLNFSFPIQLFSLQY